MKFLNFSEKVIVNLAIAFSFWYTFTRKWNIGVTGFERREKSTEKDSQENQQKTN